MGITKDGNSDGVLYRIAIEIEEDAVELVEVEACETGFCGVRGPQTF